MLSSDGLRCVFNAILDSFVQKVFLLITIPLFFSNRGRRLKFLQRVFTSYFQKKTTTEMFIFFCPLIKQRAFFILSDVDSDK